MKKVIMLGIALAFSLNSTYANKIGVNVFIDGNVPNPCTNPSAGGYANVNEHYDEDINMNGVHYDQYYSLFCTNPGANSCKWPGGPPPMEDIDPVYAQNTAVNSVCTGITSCQIFADGSHGNGNYYTVPDQNTPSYFAWSVDGQGNTLIFIYHSGN